MPPCTSASTVIQTAFGVPVGQGAGLFVRLFNTSGKACWLNGRPKVSLRGEDGRWRDFRYLAAPGSTTNDPAWTGTFDPKLVGVVVFGEATPASGPVHRFTAVRLTLPNDGGTLDFPGVDVRLTSDELTVYAVEADSQDQ